MGRTQHRFAFYEGPRVRFGCRLKMRVCRAPLPGGGTCARRTHRPPFCNIHTASELGVTVAPSGVELGDGLFACRVGGFDTGNPVAPLYGEEIDRDELHQRYGPLGSRVAPHVVDRGTSIIDGAALRGVGFFAATALGPPDEQGFVPSDPDRCNAELRYLPLTERGATTDEDRLLPWLVARRFIVPGEEIVADRGGNWVVLANPDNPFTYTTF